MKHFRHVYCIFAFALTGCAAPMRPHIAGFDGSAVDPVSKERFATECTAKAQVAGAGVPYGGGGIARAIEMDNVRQAAFTGCMAEKGLKVTWVPVDQAGAPAQPTATASVR